jgi:protein TonB
MIGAATIDRSDLGRWLLSAAVVAGLHAAAVTALLRHHLPVMGDEGGPAVIVDLAPFVTPPSESQQDLAPGPEQQFLPQPPAPPQEEMPKEEEKPKVELPPTRESDVTLPEEAKPEPPKPVPDTPPPTPTAPPRQRTASAAAVTSWNISIAKQIERHKGYPANALRRRESGVTRLVFAVDRDGRVIDRRIVESSGYAALDQEAIATLDRAQPFPPPPKGLAGERFEFRVPVKFTVK